MYTITKNIDGQPVGASLQARSWKSVLRIVTEVPIDRPGSFIRYSNQWAVDGGSTISRPGFMSFTTQQIHYFLTDLRSEYGNAVYDFQGTEPTWSNFKRFLDIAVTEREREFALERMT